MIKRKRRSCHSGMPPYRGSQPHGRPGKKISAILLAVCLVIAMIPSTAFAAEEDSDIVRIETDDAVVEDTGASEVQPNPAASEEDGIVETESDDDVLAEGDDTFESESLDLTEVLTPPTVNSNNISLRQTGETGSSYISFTDMTEEWAKAVESVTLKPVNEDGFDTVVSGEYPEAPKEITLTKGQFTADVSNNRISFTRTAEEPVVYVPMGHEPLDITRFGKTVTYPQSQIYEVTVKADGYKDVTGKVTYYTGTAPAFSIIVVDEGETEETTVKSWTAEEIEQMATFANGSSQCGMTGFRSFNGLGVTLKDLLKEAGVAVSESDYFLLDTSDHYGNKFTYEELFGTKRYFLESVYNDKELAETYNEFLKDSDDSAAGSTVALRRMLAEKQDGLVEIEPRINVKYNETMISGDAVGNSVVPTKDNTTYNDLVSYESQFRFFYGIKIGQDDVTLSFDTKGGSEIDPQLVKSHVMTSTENTTIKSSYWANSLVIYRGQGEEHKTEPSNAADKITKPEDPTKGGYTFGGWYTDEACTAGNEFDFEANDGTVDVDTTLYAKWVKKSSGSGGSGGSSATPTSFKVNVADAKNGTVKASVSSAASGAEVDITVTADNGYELDTLKVTTAGGKEAAVKSSEGKHIFTMPSEAVTITASFKIVNSADSETSFHDVAAGIYYKDAVAWAVKNEITTGVSTTQFAPDQSCNRAQTVTFLWRAAGSPEPADVNKSFTDVKEDAYYYKAVLWAVEKGITTGTSDTTFSPDDTCTRGQIAAFLYRFAQSPATDGENVFVDVASSDYYNNAIIWAAENDITTGTSQNTFSPKNACTRAQIVTFLYRYLV